MPGNPGGVGCHPTGKNYSFEPSHAPEMPSSAWGTRFVKTIINLAALNGRCTEQNATRNFSLANDDSRQMADLTHTKQFFG